MSKSKKVIGLLTATTLVSPIVATAAQGASQDRAPQQVQKSNASAIALEQSTAAVLALVVATLKVEKSAGKLVKLDESVQDKYTSLRLAYLGSLPTGGAVSAATGLGVKSVQDVEFVLKPLTLALRAIQKMGKLSVTGVEKFSIATGLDKVLTKSVDSSTDSAEFTYKNLIQPVLRVLINKNTAISSGSLSATSIATGSVLLLTNDARDAMTISQIRSILGHDRAIKMRVDAEVQGISEILNLSADQQSQLKIAIYDDIIRQAVANNFEDDSRKYQLDVLKLMAERQIVDRNTVAAIQGVRSVVAGLTSSTNNDVTTRKMIEENTDMALRLSAMLESQLLSGNIKDASLHAEMERMLGSVAAKLAMVGFNLKK